MSFFDEADEPQRAPRATARRPRPADRGGPPRRPPGRNQQVQTRRIVAAVAVLVVIVVMAIVIHGCESSQTQSSLRDYSVSVYQLMDKSNALGKQLFEKDLLGASSHANTVQNQVNSALRSAGTLASEARALSVPAAMSSAQRNLELVMNMRKDGIGMIAANIQTALSSSTSQDAVNKIAVADSYLYASDVLYKGYVGPDMAQALSSAGIAVGGSSSVQINAGQFVHDLGWLVRTNIANWIGAKLPTSVANKAIPGKVQGHSLNSVSVGTSTLSTASLNQVVSNPAPTFQLNITNSGQTNEYQVECLVKVKGLNDTGTATIAETTPGQTLNCSVTLPSPPTPGTYSVTAEVVPVPGEKDKKNNKQTFSIQFG